MQKEKKNNYFKQIIIGAIIVIIVFVVVYGVILKKNTPKDGDTASVDYTLYVGGKVFDTSVEKDAVDAGIFNEKREYKPLEVVLGQGQVIKGFEDAIRTMVKGQTKEVEINPEDGYGLKDEKRIFKGLNKILTINKTDSINLTDFVSIFNREPKLGEILKDVGAPWDLKVLSIKGDIVQIENVLADGQTINIPGASWESKVDSIEGNTVKIKQYISEGDNVVVPTPGGAVRGVAINAGDETYDIDLNSPLAGKTLKFKITLVDVKSSE